MSFRKSPFVTPLAALVVSIGILFADGPLVSAALPATTATSITLTITTASGGVTVTDGGSGTYSVSFSSVNGLGLGTPAPSVSVSTSAGGATYTTPITITPTFSGFPEGARATIRVYQDPGTDSTSQTAAREGATAVSVVSVPTSLGAATNVASLLTSGTAVTRHVGVFVSNANGPSRVTGSLAPKLIYEVTVN